MVWTEVGYTDTGVTGQQLENEEQPSKWLHSWCLQMEGMVVDPEGL